MAVPVIYVTEGDQNEWWRFYWQPGTNDWSHPESVASAHGHFNGTIAFNEGDNLYLARHSNFGCNYNEHVSDEGGYLLEFTGSFATIYYPPRNLLAPVYPDSGNNFEIAQGTQGGGPLKHGTSLWVWGYNGTRGLTIYESTNNGATWTEKDTAGAPSGPFAGAVSSSYDAAGEKLYLLFKTTTTGLKWVAFDLSAKTWGTQSATFTAGATIGPNISLHRRSNGDLIAVYNRLGSYVYLAVYSAGAWGGETTVQTTTDTSNSRPHKAAMDSADLLHIVYTNNDAGGVDLSYYRTFDDTNTFNTEAAVSALNSLSLQTCYFTAAVAYDGTVWFTAFGPTNSGNGGVPHFKGPPDGVTTLEFVYPAFAPDGISIGLGVNPCECGALYNLGYQ